MKHKFIFASSMVLALGLAACSDGDDAAEQANDADAAAMATNTMTPAGTGETATADSHAAQFLTDAMKGDNSEVRVGKLAARKGSSQGVKDFGGMLADDHGKHLTKVSALAQSMNVPPTDETKPEADQLYAKLQGLSGADFDKAFVAGMIADHKKDIDAYQQEANSSDPTEVTSMAKETVPTLQTHLKTAQSLQ